MTALHLRPFPSLHSDDVSKSTIADKDGFVDEAVVRSLVSGPICRREIPISAELALAVDDMDFAGWCLPQTQSTTQSKTAALPQARPAPPVHDEPGLGDPHRGNHRWWLAGLAGALSTLLFSMLLLSLSARSLPTSGDHFNLELLTRPPSPSATEIAPPRVATPQLTEIVR